MGYTHYFRRLTGENALAFSLFSRDCWRLFSQCEAQGIALAGPLGDGDPQITMSHVAFNGAAPEDYETFSWSRLVRPWDKDNTAGRVFDCCKTAQRPYDVAVVAALLLAHSYYGDAVSLGSDGDAPDLAPALALLAEAFPGRQFSLAPFLGACVA
jgi:hypothetical protein